MNRETCADASPPAPGHTARPPPDIHRPEPRTEFTRRQHEILDRLHCIQEVRPGLASPAADGMAVGMPCADSRSRGTLHMEGQAAAGVAIGTGSVGMIVVEALARTGIQNLSLFEFYTVEDVNLDRLLRATARDARLHRAKVDLAARTVHRAATAMNIRVTPHETSVTEPDGFAATDCDVIFSYVDRSWPRAALNLLAKAHLILVVDGGIAVDARGGRLNDTWGAHVAMERDGLLDNPAYIKGSAPDHPLRRKENVFIFSASAAATQLNSSPP